MASFFAIFFINDLIFFIEHCTVSKYADANNLSISREDKTLCFHQTFIIMIVEGSFFENYMILNPGKCYFMCIGKNVSDSELLNLNDLNLKNCKEVEILGITIDRNLNFKGHIKNISRKAGQKLSVSLRISSHINHWVLLAFIVIEGAGGGGGGVGGQKGGFCLPPSVLLIDKW